MHLLNCFSARWEKSDSQDGNDMAKISPGVFLKDSDVSLNGFRQSLAWDPKFRLRDLAAVTSKWCSITSYSCEMCAIFLLIESFYTLMCCENKLYLVCNIPPIYYCVY